MEDNFNFLVGEWTSRQRRLREVLKGSCRRCSGASLRTARVFTSEEEYEGIPTICRDLWIRIAPHEATWEQACSTDGGETWETNRVAELSRTAGSGG